MTQDEMRMQISALEDRNIFNENLYRRKFENSKQVLAQDISKDISLEIMGIEDILESVPENKRVKIQRRLDNIDRILSKYKEEI